MSDIDIALNSITTDILRLKAEVAFLKGLPVPALATAATANTVVLRDGSGNATTSLLNTSGITFPASPIAAPNARTITYFEEGDWTPGWGGTTTNPTVTYTRQQGHYMRAGNTVTIFGSVVISAVSVAGTGNLRLTGLPFTVSATPGLRGSIFFGYAFGFTAPAPSAGIPDASATTISMFGYNSTDARTDRATFTLASSLTASTVVFFAGSYAV